MDLRILEERINNAIDVRESGELKKSRPLFESILKDVNILLQKDSSKELKNIYTTAMGQYVIQYRLEAGQFYKSALDLGRELYKYDKMNKIGNSLSIRAVSNTLINIGSFEQAEAYLRELIPLFENNSAQKGDTKAHLALCLLRQSKLGEAKKLMEEAIEGINKNTAKKKKEFIATWLSHALIVKSLILNADNNRDGAMDSAKESLRVSKREKRVFRIAQAKELIRFLKEERI